MNYNCLIFSQVSECLFLENALNIVYMMFCRGHLRISRTEDILSDDSLCPVIPSTPKARHSILRSLLVSLVVLPVLHICRLGAVNSLGAH